MVKLVQKPDIEGLSSTERQHLGSKLACIKRIDEKDYDTEDEDEGDDNLENPTVSRATSSATLFGNYNLGNAPHAIDEENDLTTEVPVLTKRRRQSATAMLVSQALTPIDGKKEEMQRQDVRRASMALGLEPVDEGEEMDILIEPPPSLRRVQAHIHRTSPTSTFCRIPLIQSRCRI